MAFYETGLSSIRFPDTLIRIGCYAFRGCARLEEAVFPGSLQLIDMDAFAESGLKAVRFLPARGAEKRTISFGAFADCIHLEKAEFPEDHEDGPVWEFMEDSFNGTPWQAAMGDFVIRSGRLVCYQGKEEQVTVPEEVTSIADRAFRGNGNIKKVIIGPGVKTIGRRAFFSCTSLKEVTIHTGLEELGNGAFENCRALKDIRLPGSLRVIGRNAFHGCGALEEIILPPDIRRIESGTFFFCESLKKVVLPKNLEQIAAAFEECTSLRKITIPKGVKRIEVLAFNGCTHLDILYEEGYQGKVVEPEMI